MTAQDGTATGWLRWPARRPDAGLRLVCFPHAGGGASAYWRWPRLLPADIEVLAVQYPGRQDRFADPFADSLVGMAGPIAAEIAALDGPVALFGHSMGALVAFEVASLLGAGGAGGGHPGSGSGSGSGGLAGPGGPASGEAGRLVRLVVSAHPAPTRPRESRPAGDSDQAVIDYLRELGGAGASLLDDPDLRELTLPMVRNDLRMVRNYRYVPRPPLDCPVTAVAGSRDRSCPAGQMCDWAAQTSAGFDLAVLAGDHFYTETSTGSLVTALVDRFDLHGLPAY